MICFETERLICKSDLCVEYGHLVELPKENPIDILNIRPATGREHGFAFYSKESQSMLVCHIGIIFTRDRFEVSYGVDSVTLRNQGYMTEALQSLCEWLFNNTGQDTIWALPNGEDKDASIRALEKCNFKVSDRENGLVWYECRKG